MQNLKKLMGFGSHIIIRPFIILVLLFVAACSQKADKDRYALQIASLDSTLAKVHTMADTGFKNSSGFLAQLDSLEKKCIQYKHQEGRAKVFFTKGSIARHNSQYDSALSYYFKTYDIVRGSNTKVETDILLEMGEVYRYINKKKVANEYYLTAFDIAYKTKNEELQAFVLSRLGTIFYLQNNYTLALDAYKQSLAYIKRTDYQGEHKTKQLQLYNNIALCYVKSAKYDTAHIYYDSALLASDSLVAKVKATAGGVVRGNIGRLYQLMGEYEKAIPLLKGNIAVNTQPSYDNADAVTSYTYLLEIYIKTDSLAQFKKIIDTAIGFANTVKRGDMKQWESKLMGLKSEYYSKLKDYNQALIYKNKQWAIADSISKAAETETLEDMILYRQLSEQDKKMAMMEKDNRLQKSKLSTFLSIAVLGVLLLIVAVISLNINRRNLKGQQKLNKQIAIQNEEITLSKRELEQAIEELKILDTEKNRLLGMVAHDLRGPIYNISGVVALIEGAASYDKMDGDDIQLIELIKKSCDNALDVINDLLEAAKLDAMGAEMTKEPENLWDVMQSAIALYTNQAQLKNIKIVVSPPSEAVIAAVSKEKISRAMGNLISNAIKFSNRGEDINIVLTNTSTSALISIADKGMGIPETDKEVIFDKFTRAKRPGTAGEKPIGLGMSIVKQIVEAHNGRLWFESEVNHGTTFYIELPLV